MPIKVKRIFLEFIINSLAAPQKHGYCQVTEANKGMSKGQFGEDKQCFLFHIYEVHQEEDVCECRSYKELVECSYNRIGIGEYLRASEPLPEWLTALTE
ncbi:MAG: hypothetical protein DRO62_00850 [Candidatus Altiarchaeales archaeon]|nr:MAG: hypothetical protein DRO62_00850 [Candidatus Altiarchaeales archaeon]